MTDNEYEKQMYDKRNAADFMQAQSGELRTGATIGEVKRQSMQERIASQLYRSTREARNAEALRELQYLLEKNPEVARILDLMEAVRDF